MKNVFKRIEHFAEDEEKKVLAGAKVVAAGVVADTEDKVVGAVLTALIPPEDGSGNPIPPVDGSGNPLPAAK